MFFFTTLVLGLLSENPGLNNDLTEYITNEVVCSKLVQSSVICWSQSELSTVVDQQYLNWQIYK